jgi:hypothetical protein
MKDALTSQKNESFLGPLLQIVKSLAKLKEYEKQVEAIPVLQVKLSVLKEEKRLLILKLKQRELQLKRETGAADLVSQRRKNVFSSPLTMRPNKLERLSLASLFSLV